MSADSASSAAEAYRLARAGRLGETQPLAEAGGGGREPLPSRWAAEAVDIRRNNAVSLTAGAAQVRRPIYGSSSCLWRRYRRHLGPLIAALRARGISLPEDG